MRICCQRKLCYIEFIGDEDFIPNYCNRGERLNSTSLKQKAGDFKALR